MRVKDARQTFLGYWLRLVLEGQTIRVFGDGAQQRDFTYIDDAVEAFLLAGSEERALGQIYNLGGNECVSLVELARLLVELNGGGDFELVPFPADRKAIDIGHFYADYTKIFTELGWQPHTELREGLSKTLAYLSAEHSRYW
jgi:nucleoside-diphosphate-sugar epimerase